MGLNLKTRRANLTPEIEKYCEKRLRRLERLIGQPIGVDVLLGIEKGRSKVEINVKTKKSSFNTIEETHDMSTSLTLAFDNIEKRIKKEKEKIREKKRRKNRVAKPFPISLQEKEEAIPIARYRDYSLKPMPLEEALQQFRLNRKEIFAFKTIETEKWAVLFRKKDGNVGLMELE